MRSSSRFCHVCCQPSCLQKILNTQKWFPSIAGWAMTSCTIEEPPVLAQPLSDSATFINAKSVCFVRIGTAGDDEIVYLQIKTEEAGLREILERILTGVIVFDPLARLQLTMTDLKSAAARVVVAPERRLRPFIVPRRQAGGY
jgi:hypothetical protein